MKKAYRIFYNRTTSFNVVSRQFIRDPIMCICLLLVLYEQNSSDSARNFRYVEIYMLSTNWKFLEKHNFAPKFEVRQLFILVCRMDCLHTSLKALLYPRNILYIVKAKFAPLDYHIVSLFNIYRLVCTKASVQYKKSSRMSDTTTRRFSFLPHMW